MKLFNKVAAIAVGLSLAAGVGAGIVLGQRDAVKADATTADSTAATSITSGKKYLVTAIYNSKTYYLTPGQSALGTGKVLATAIATIPSATEAMCWTFTGSGTTWTVSANGFYLANTNDNNGVKTESSSQNWTSSFNGSTLTLTGANSRKLALYQSSNWRCYTSNSGVQALKIYEYQSGGSSVSVTGVTVNPTSATVKASKTTSLTATVAPSDASNKNVAWSSSDTDIATVDSSGVVTGVDVGTATITATTADGGFTASSTITVSLPDYEDVNVANAITATNALADNAVSEGYYKVTGYVIGITIAYDSSYGNISFTIADAKDGTPVLTCFRVSCTAEVAATILKDAKVSLIGKLEKFVKNSNVTPELVNSLPSQLTILEPGIAQQTHVVTFDEALTVLSGLTEGQPTYDKYTLEGVVTEITHSYSSGKISFNIGETESSTDVIKVYDIALSAEDAAKVQVGATIRVTGNLEVYNSTNELVNGESFELISAPVIDDWEYVGQYVLTSEGSYTVSKITYNYKVEFAGVSSSLGSDSEYVFAAKCTYVLTVSASTNGGEYLISYEDNSTTQYLKCDTTKKLDVTTDPTDSTAIWTFGLSNGSLVATNATTQDSGKDLVLQYNPNSGAGRFACYSSTQKVASFVSYDKTAKAGAFVESYMHPEIAHNIEDADTGACKDSGSGYYTAAKTAYNLLDAETKTEFAGNNSFANYVARLTAWASANGETFDASAGTFTASASRTLTPFSEPSSAAALVVVVMSAVSVTAIGGFFLLKRKPF